MPRRRYVLLLGAAVAVAFGIRLVYAFTDDSPSTDMTAYLRSGTSIWEGEGFRRDNEPELHFPPALPFVLGGIAEVVGDPHLAGVVLTLVTGTALVLPLAGIGRLIGGDRGALGTAWVVALTPALTNVMVNRGGGSEAPYTLLVASALWVVLSAHGGPRRRILASAAGAGALVGMAYLIRPEGLLYSAVLLPALVLSALGGWRALRSRRIPPGGRAGAAGAAGAFTLALASFVAPYVSYLHDKTGSWQLTAKTQDASIEAWRAVAEGDRAARDAVLYALDETGVSFAAGRSTLLELIREDPAGYLGIVGVNIERLVSAYLPLAGGGLVSWGLLPSPVLALGAWGAWHARRHRSMQLVLLASLIPVATTLAFFVQARYLIPVTALLCVPIGVALGGLRGRWRRWAGGGAIALLALSTLAGLHGPAGWFAPRESVENRVVGEWIATNLPPQARVMTRSMVIEFYAERPTVAMPYAEVQEIVRFAHYHGVDYLVADEFHLRRMRPQLEELFGPLPIPGLRLVAEFEIEQRVTRVFALDPPPAGFTNRAPRLGFTGDDPG